MKQFNKTIEIKVSVDSIAAKLYDSMKIENPHAEMITETIIESMLVSGHIGLLYNNLNGWTNELNFKKGDVLVCSAKEYSYKLTNETAMHKNADIAPAYDRDYVVIGDCIVEEINVFRNSDQINIKFLALDREGKSKEFTRWVSPETLTVKEETDCPAIG